MVEKYLLNRKGYLEEIIKVNTEKYEHNQIAIVEINNQIKELNNTADEATQMFSVKAREDTGFKKHEIIELENRIAVYVSKNKEFTEIIQQAEQEVLIVNECLGEMEKTNVSRETLKENYLVKHITTENEVGCKDEEILDKLEFCKNIAQIDAKRASLEIDNLIRKIKNNK